MHIHYLSTSTLISDTANSVHVMKMCGAFVRLGHTVTLHAYKGSGTKEDIYKYYGTDSNFDIERYNEKENGWSSTLWRLRKKFSFIRVAGLPSLLFSRQILAPKFKRLDKNTLIFGRNLYWLSGLPKNIPFIAETHHPPSNKLEFFLERRLYKRHNCHGVVVISNKLKEIYLSIFPELENKIIVAHDAANDPDIKLPETPKPTVKKIGYVGHLYKGRGADLILEIAKRLPEIEFHFVGGKDEAIKILKSQTKEMPNNTIFHGHQPHSMLKKHFLNFDVVLAPYQQKVSVGGDSGDTSAFMSPLKIFEYMSYGLPIICSDMPVLREVLHDKENALLVPSNDVNAWVDAVKTLHSDASIKHQISLQAHSDFKAHYSWLNRVKSILKEASI